MGKKAAKEPEEVTEEAKPTRVFTSGGIKYEGASLHEAIDYFHSLSEQ